jgi:hypothetical protein
MLTPKTVKLDDVDVERLAKLAAYKGTSEAEVMRYGLFLVWQRYGVDAERLAQYRAKMEGDK